MATKFKARRLNRKMCKACLNMYNPTGKYQDYCDNCQRERREEAWKKTIKVVSQRKRHSISLQAKIMLHGQELMKAISSRKKVKAKDINTPTH